MTKFSAMRSGMAALTLVVVGALPAAAAPADVYDGTWHFSFAPYVWLPAFSGNFDFDAPPGIDGRPSVHARAGDLLSALKFALMGTGDARKGNWSAFTDFMYVNLAHNDGQVRTITLPNGIVEIPINIDTEAGLENTVWTLAGAYSVYHDGASSVDAFVGTRYLNARPSVNWNLSGPLGLFPKSGRFGERTAFWDAIIGVKGRCGFGSSPWFIDYYADVGTGEANLTWQAVAGGGYAFPWGDVGLSFRYLAYNPGSTKIVRDIALYGPALGVRFYF